MTIEFRQAADAMLEAHLADPGGDWPRVVAADPDRGPGRVLVDDRDLRVIVCPLTTTTLPAGDSRVVRAAATAQRLLRQAPSALGWHANPAALISDQGQLRVVCWVTLGRPGMPPRASDAAMFAVAGANAAPLVAAELPDARPLTVLALPEPLRDLVDTAAGYAARGGAPRLTVRHLAAALLRDLQPATLWHDRDDRPAAVYPAPDGPALRLLDAAAGDPDPVERLHGLVVAALADLPAIPPAEPPGDALDQLVAAHPDWLFLPRPTSQSPTAAAAHAAAQLSRFQPPVVMLVSPPGTTRQHLIDTVAAALPHPRTVLIVRRSDWHDLTAYPDVTGVLRSISDSVVLVLDGALDRNADRGHDLVALLVQQAISRSWRVLLTAATEVALDLSQAMVTVHAPAIPSSGDTPEPVPVLDDHANFLALYHRVAIDPAAVAAAAAPPPEESQLHHPALGIDRLDLAAAAAAQRPDRTVTVGDISLDPLHPTATAAVDVATLDAALRARIVGQDHITSTLPVAIAAGASRLRQRSGPWWVGLAVGEPGLGKTTLGYAIADGVFGGQLIKIDCATLWSDHTVATLLGAPPSYVGSDQPERWLTTRLEAAKSGVLLLDEISRAHPRVLEVFLAALSDGWLVDLQGRRASIRRFVVLATSNTASDLLSIPAAGFTPRSTEDAEALVRRQLRETLRPEFLDRMDAILVFHPLSRASLLRLARRHLDELADRSRRAGYSIYLTEDVAAAIASLAAAAGPGARELARIIDSRLIQPLLSRPPGSYIADVTADGALEWTVATMQAQDLAHRRVD